MLCFRPRDFFAQFPLAKRKKKKNKRRGNHEFSPLVNKVRCFLKQPNLILITTLWWYIYSVYWGWIDLRSKVTRSWSAEELGFESRVTDSAPTHETSVRLSIMYHCPGLFQHHQILVNLSKEVRCLRIPRVSHLNVVSKHHCPHQPAQKWTLNHIQRWAKVGSPLWLHESSRSYYYCIISHRNNCTSSFPLAHLCICFCGERNFFPQYIQLTVLAISLFWCIHIKLILWGLLISFS